uniref:Glycyl-radical enzyme activating protein n=1 Tax=candidate division WOR-3 bacterium TaxID=2052148 RepID=A0A7C2K2L7_UNCW3
MSKVKDKSIRGMIFNIQRYSIHDGPGIRTTVFMKKCPLRCFWCQNPESQNERVELFFYQDKCTGCGRCVEICTQKAIEIYEGVARTNRERCKGPDKCGKCVEVCPNAARSIIGRMMSANEVFQEVKKDMIFYEASGGGVTLSGGEPLAQAEFAEAILKLCKEVGLHTAIDTCGYAKWENIEKVFKYVDLVLFDFKHMDPFEHQKGTGVPNYLILENAKRIHRELKIPLVARIPIIPGYNDSEYNLVSIAKFIVTELDASVKVNLLPYHNLGIAKYIQLEREKIPFNIELPSENKMEEIKNLMESFGLEITIGG